ncbi:hypothetical protein MTO96_011941 [Rhipicephalus appendiculatus]
MAQLSPTTVVKSWTSLPVGPDAATAITACSWRAPNSSTHAEASRRSKALVTPSTRTACGNQRSAEAQALFPFASRRSLALAPPARLASNPDEDDATLAAPRVDACLPSHSLTGAFAARRGPGAASHGTAKLRRGTLTCLRETCKLNSASVGGKRAHVDRIPVTLSRASVSLGCVML